ncbi:MULTISPECIES: 1-acyl-sn-glycerol-3-phosphate acyltransferase [Trichocoleus]|uniref:1-acyl-sn-glycerol-3-phosphate acyltransferase n=1 Tax=Trichocoleus desertorum GB2-A4 TaxID=2933944 RepID=A0ABV0JAI4_9CYAN|nr:1-acyl-sn-glycerol-3-phosphate acyltransferase [Trichocoleus sp. FACHB-46]MBD1861375.1 1-acyl-sn-glycerol-3-phosphate acyltransferase [Trichocoleus sp. FACHB-46]
MNWDHTAYNDASDSPYDSCPNSTEQHCSPALKSPSAYRFIWFDWFCLWYPPGWLILFNRHWQHYHDDPEGWNWLDYMLFLIPGGFYLASLIRWLRLGCRAPRSEGGNVNPAYQQAFQDEILGPIVQHYFRAELHQLEHLPVTGPLVVVMNHAGMAFPWDFISLGWLLKQERNWVIQPLAHTIFFDHPWLNWWLPPSWPQVLGGVRAERQTFEVAVANAETETVVLYAPEGWRGLIKGWRQRYQLTTFDPSFIQVSDRHHVPILPVTCIGNELLHPWAWNFKTLARWIKLPLFPISLLMVAFVLFPSMGVWAMRSRLKYTVQPLYQPWQEAGVTAPDQPKRSHAYQQAQALRSQLQDQLNQIRSSAKSK